jgi:outer membrane immunogenic protein
MKHFAGFMTGALALAAFAGSALSDGMVVRSPAPPPAPPPVTDRCAPGPWTGFYIGGNLGWASLDGDFRDHDRFFSHRRHWDDEEDSFTAGIQGGYNLQCGNVVFGFETDINWADFDRDKVHWGHFFPFEPFHRSRSMDWFGTIRGRIGWTNDRVMVYATAGAAYTDLEREWHGFGGTVMGPTTVISSEFHHRDSDDVSWGWVGGGGIEWLWSPNLTFKAEALWIEFEDGSSRRPILFEDGYWRPHRFDFEDELVVVRVGLNYKFGYRAPPPYEPLK